MLIIATFYGPLAALVMLMFSIAVCSEAIYFGMYVIFECHIRRLIKKIIKEKVMDPYINFKKRAKQIQKYMNQGGYCVQDIQTCYLGLSL